MFEGSFALKYLIPKRKQLSTSIIALLSIGVIALVIWLLLLFLSFTEGMEQTWMSKVTAMNAPLRIHPTPQYFHSYYYRIDRQASQSGYAVKTIGQKASAPSSDPYRPEFDVELPADFPKPVRKWDGSLLDPVKELYAILEGCSPKFEGFGFQDCALSGALMHLNASQQSTTTTDIYQATYVATIPEKNKQFRAMVEEGSIHATEMASPMVLLPKVMKECGVKIGDSGYFSYTGWITGSLHEQRLPFVVSGFYNPGLLPIGNRSVFVPKEVTTLLNSVSSSFQLPLSDANGVLVWFDRIREVEQVKKTIISALREQGVEPYWKVTSFQEYPFAKEMIQQFQSDKLLLTLIGILILLIAICNIISLLLFLVRDKKKEIGILSAMGASGRSISLIFAFAGMIIGSIGCLIGIAAASLTMHFIHPIVDSLRFLQGNSTLNLEMFAGSYPTKLSRDALLLALLLTPTLSCLAAFIPAWKASRLQPFQTLKDSS